MENNSKIIREKWVNFFKEKKHLILKRSSLIPIDDESILFINSGIATLKKYFTEEEIPPSKRMANIQPVIRTGDIDNVGKTSRHHTFFEMMGNFSINDYFKKDAIKFAYEFLTSEKYLNIDKKILYITVFKNDMEAERIWRELGIKLDHIFRMEEKTNFWDLGFGPCGPSTEIFYDKGEEYSSKNAEELIKNDIENDRFIEIWNIVFSEFNNDGKGNYISLPQKNIDTGAGLERICSCLEKTPTNFETEIFRSIIEKIEKLSTYKYLYDYIPQKLMKENNEQFKINSYFKAISDFIRTVTFAINDGAIPGPNGRGYVIRRLIRKSVLYARKLKIKNLFFADLSQEVINLMKKYYPELEKNALEIKNTIKNEEDKFAKNLKRALSLFKKEDWKNITEKKAFMYYETYGLPIEFIYELLEESNINLNKEKIEKYYKEFQEKSKKGMKETNAFSNNNDLFSKEKATNFVGYETLKTIGKIINIKNEYVIFDKTPFYATSGGQIYDIGKANDFNVIEVQKNKNKTFIHKIPGHNFKIGEKVVLQVNEKRRKQITMHHSSAHLIFSALELVLDTQINQVGSKVTDKELRFDFYYNGKITDEDLKKAENKVNEWIKTKEETITTVMSIDEAKKIGATFLENTKYDKNVRVVKLNEQTIDLCGGTHVSNLIEIEEIKIIKFEKKGTNVYRISAVAGFDLIKEYLIKEREKILKENLEQAEKIEEDLRSKLDFYDPKFLIKVSLMIMYIKRSDIYDENWNDNIKKWIKELENVKNYVLKEIELNFKNTLINFLSEEKINQILRTKNFSVKEISNLALKIIDDYENKILRILVINNDKISLIFVITKDLINSEKIKNEIENIKKIGLKGSGKDQLYIFGSKIDLLDEIKKVYKIWKNF
ncbi:MAG: alanine--tRNA ligase [Candidatus Hepatoplasma vulgare]|nr:MAG: alanine--tRNA ligase [Candidatus Hepatoplasma sp.]